MNILEAKNVPIENYAVLDASEYGHLNVLKYLVDKLIKTNRPIPENIVEKAMKIQHSKLIINRKQCLMLNCECLMLNCERNGFVTIQHLKFNIHNFLLHPVHHPLQQRRSDEGGQRTTQADPHQ